MPDPAPIHGIYRITQMDQWDQDYVDEEVEGYFRFDPGGAGRFQFGYVRGLMSVEQTTRGRKRAVEWTWEGNDEMDEANGRGWATLQKDGTIKGTIYFHLGDQSGFLAEPKSGPAAEPKE